MNFGRYGKMIFRNMEKNYPYRKKELEETGELETKINEKEQDILVKREKIEMQIKAEYTQPKTNEMFVVAKYQQMIDGLVDEILMKDILEKI